MRYRKGRFEVKPEILDADWAPVYENPTHKKDPRRYIRLRLDRNTSRNRRRTRFVKKLLLVSMFLFLLALLLGAVV